MPPFEPPQKLNPHQLTVNQHVFPKKSISRFCDDDSGVSVFHIPTRKFLKLRPDAKIFCAKRVWDQRAESGYMLQIENDFQSLVKNVINEKVKYIGHFELPVVNKFFSLWYFRFLHTENRIEDMKLSDDATVTYNASKDEQERLEKNHISYVRPDLTMPGRQIAGAQIQLSVARAAKHLCSSEWGIIRSNSGEFLVPDNFSNAQIIPISPSICLAANQKNQIADKYIVASINQLALLSAKNHLFARNFSECPLNCFNDRIERATAFIK